MWCDTQWIRHVVLRVVKHSQHQCVSCSGPGLVIYRSWDVKDSLSLLHSFWYTVCSSHVHDKVKYDPESRTVGCRKQGSAYSVWSALGQGNAKNWNKHSLQFYSQTVPTTKTQTWPFPSYKTWPDWTWLVLQPDTPRFILALFHRLFNSSG